MAMPKRVHFFNYAERVMPNGRTITNQMCWCGRLMTEHRAHGPIMGHGGCSASGCEQFTFKRYIAKKTPVTK